jgi:hypothetical protein
VAVCDPFRACATATTSVTILNAAPTATFTAPASVTAGSPIPLSFIGASDPSAADAAAGFGYAFDCGVGAGFGPFGPSGVATCPTTSAGTRAVRGRVRDKDGGVSEYAASVTVTPGGPGPQPTVGATTWYFAEGYTGAGFDEYLTILNPNPADAQVRITYYLGGGQPPLIRALTAPANRRTTVAVHDPLQGVGRNREVSAKVEATNGVGLIVERPMYFRYGAAVTGGHVVLGATAPRPTWLFAEGYTGPGFDEYLTILNPNPSDVGVAITYYLGGGRAPVVKLLTARASARTTVAVHDDVLGVGRDREVAAKVEATNGAGLVVERPMYVTYGGAITGGHDVLGAEQPRLAWHFAEGYTGTGFDQYLTILNPNASDAAVTITYYLGGGQAPVARTLTAPARARTTVAVHDGALGVGRDREVSASVTTTKAGGIVAERPMYFRYRGSMGAVTGGHDVLGAGEPATSWYVAEGYTGDGFDEYLTLLNPSPTTAAVTLTYYLASGGPVEKALMAPANSRTTVAVHETGQGVGRGQAVSARVASANGVGLVVERPMYFVYGGGIDGGHDALGYAPSPSPVRAGR